MSADDNPLLGLAAAVADGMTVDWTAALRGSSSDAERVQIEELAAIAMLASLHSVDAAPAIRSSPDPLQNLPCQWGPLVVQAPVGYGSSGVVYRAWDARLDRLVALKMLHDRTHWDDVLREGRLLARVRHPNVVTVFGAERIGEDVGLWMEFIEGRTLAHEVRDSGPLSAAQAMSVAIDIAGALAGVHAAGLVHRDIKAHNVLRDRAGRVVLTDFGTGHEQGAPAAAPLAGTPLYLAPEVLAGGPATIASDIYSLGVLLFFLTSGTYPVPAESLSELRSAHARGERKSLRDVRRDLPRRFVAAVERALMPDPAKRFATAVEFRRSLDLSNSARRALLVGAGAGLSVYLAIAAAAHVPASGWPFGNDNGSGVPGARFADQVTAPSPDAHKLFKEAHAMFFEGSEGMVRAERLLSEVVHGAPDFASAHILLAWAIRNQGRPDGDVLSHADRAVQFAANLPPTERLFITGSSHQMHGRNAEAIADYERLLRLDPEHYWALGNLAMVYNVTGERPKFLVDLYERKAQLSPTNIGLVTSTAFELTKLGEVSRARPFVHEALKLRRDDDSIGWLDFAQAYDAWLSDDPTEMRLILDRLRGRLSVMTGQDRTVTARDLGLTYLDIGQIATASVLFKEQEATDSSNHQLIALAASVRGDLSAVRSALTAHMKAGAPWSHPEIGPMFFDAGLPELGFELLQRWQREKFWEPRLLKTFLAESLLVKGQADEARSMLRASIDENRAGRPSEFGILWHGGAPLLRASLTLARLEAMNGRAFSAIRILEEASQDRVRACVVFHGNGYLWLQIRADLARLYAGVGRRQDAERVEGQVRHLLELADEDHPLKHFRVAAAGTHPELN